MKVKNLKTKITVFTFILIISCSVHAMAAPTEAITNGIFDGNLNGWSSQYAHTTTEEDYVYEGTHSVFLSEVTGQTSIGKGHIKQSFSTSILVSEIDSFSFALWMEDASRVKVTITYTDNTIFEVIYYVDSSHDAIWVEYNFDISQLDSSKAVKSIEIRNVTINFAASLWVIVDKVSLIYDPAGGSGGGGSGGGGTCTVRCITPI